MRQNMQCIEKIQNFNKIQSLTQFETEKDLITPTKLIFNGIASLENIQSTKLQRFKQLTPQLQVGKSRNFLLSKKANSDSLLSELSMYAQTYNEIETLGEGFQSVCKKIQNKETNEFRVAKINRSTIDPEILSQLKEEINILKKFETQENIIQGFEIYESQSQFIQIIEFIDAQSLSDQLFINDYSEDEIIQIAFKLLKALKEMHSQQIIHRDITLSNILYNKSKNILKLIDFGIAKKYNEDEVMSLSQAGNNQFKAPEMLKNRVYSDKIDLWGVGLVLYSLITKKVIESKTIIGKNKLNKPLQFPVGISQNLQELVRGLLAIKKKERLSAQEALLMPIFQA